MQRISSPSIFNLILAFPFHRFATHKLENPAEKLPKTKQWWIYNQNKTKLIFFWQSKLVSVCILNKFVWIFTAPNRTFYDIKFLTKFPNEMKTVSVFYRRKCVRKKISFSGKFTSTCASLLFAYHTSMVEMWKRFK